MIRHDATIPNDSQEQAQKANSAIELLRLGMDDGKRDVICRRTVFERDGWVCYICGVAVDRKARVPWPTAPTIDHVVPLSKGGTHTLDNVRCACFRCNSRKRDSIVNTR